MFRFLLLLPLTAALAGCITTSGRHIDDAERAQLRAENKSIVLLHTSLHDAGCHLIQARLAQPDASGRYVHGDLVSLRGFYDPKVPSQLTLPAGDYAIVQLTCLIGKRSIHYNARVVQRGSILDASGTIYDRPIATFKVGTGEVVDIGSVRLPSKTTPGGFFRAPRSEFIAIVTPIPAEWLAALAEGNPKLIQDRVVRPMTAAVRI
jgi:hypothetical protein